ncbi:FKBP-type peptidyl-prolyl cis-trans isomerase [Shewanella psychrotolerans]|uniref:FKBP-type peptidyl-prolyl cis-trans isomerase n=1 Tax=Shewanella psychrotolerans TaxID=2864206 RepID=UPI001C6606B9|nr:FKBP-type peptidyl-prolyl cis-trans isomerase [Shewanella psychrotolerans]QYK01113.1 FKBP-type peptidyl-prolyl cis-trans isomerase [Shewanella psychrotolerans]
MARKQTSRSKGSSGSNRKNSEQFLEKFSRHPNTVVCESGLMYKVIELVEGLYVSETDTVVINQRILLADGSVIADSYREGMPETFELREAIDGLREGILLMPIGSRYEFVLPPELAWGKKGNGGKIGANAVLHFDVRLIRTA